MYGAEDRLGLAACKASTLATALTVLFLPMLDCTRLCHGIARAAPGWGLGESLFQPSVCS